MQRIFISLARPLAANHAILLRSFTGNQLSVRFASKKSKDAKPKDSKPAYEFDEDAFKRKLEADLSYFEKEAANLTSRKATPALLAGLSVSINQKATMIDKLCQIIPKDSNTLMVVVPDEELVSLVEKAIRNSKKSLNPTRNGTNLLIKVPKLSSETKKETIAKLKDLGEKSKVKIRLKRQEERTKLKSSGLLDDIDLDPIVASVIKKIDSIVEQKSEQL